MQVLNDNVYKQIANEYVERYGQELHDELNSLEKIPGVSISELNLERRVRKMISDSKNRKYVPIISTVAACLVVALLSVTWLLNLNPPLESLQDEEPWVAESADNMNMPQPDAAKKDDAVPPDRTGAPDPKLEPSESEIYEIIPLSALLPYGFTQVDFDQDYGKSIYFIEDKYQDDVVMTLEFTDMPKDLTGLTEINLGGTTAYGIQTESYSLLMFMVDDVLYTLTSQYDVNTLLRLGIAFV